MSNWKLALGALIIIGGGAALYETGHLPALPGLGKPGGAAPAGGGMGMGAMPVPVAAVVKKTIPLYLEYSARMESIRNISLQARAPGYMAAQNAADGADVKQGALLYTIDPRDLQAALDQANAQAQRDNASLDYARANFDRGTELVKSGFVAKDTYDQRESAMRQAQAALVSDHAAIRTAQLNLGYTEIHAPFSGRLGRNQAPVGTLISVAGAPINTLVQLDPIYVTFNPSESEIAKIQQARTHGDVKADVFMPDAPKPLHSGQLTFIDNAVDKTTGTIVARATISNPDFSLLPGQYVRVRLLIGEQANALMAPQTAVGASQFGSYLYVIGAGNKVEQRMVTLGPTGDDGLVSITSGLKEGDQIITGNMQKIGPGMPVQPLPATANAKAPG